MLSKRIYFIIAAVTVLICSIAPLCLIEMDDTVVESGVLTSRPTTESEASMPEVSEPENDNTKKEYYGKIVEAFLSPYTAKIKYDGIYLNNRTDSEINLEEIYNSPPNISFKKNGEPEVLILHTHATEGYMTEPSEGFTQEDIDQTTDSTRSVITVGEIIKDKLAEYGIAAVHDTTLHDDPSYQDSYNRAAETTGSYLEKYPSIKIVIDIHRDSVSAKDGLIKGVSEQNGKDAAQIMFVAGSQTGKVTDFPHWKENLKLVLRLQQMAEKLYPGLARAIYFTSKKYNQHLSPGSILIEVGTSVNTVEEARYSAELVGNVLGITFNLFAEE